MDQEVTRPKAPSLLAGDPASLPAGGILADLEGKAGARPSPGMRWRIAACVALAALVVVLLWSGRGYHPGFDASATRSLPDPVGVAGRPAATGEGVEAVRKDQFATRVDGGAVLPDDPFAGSAILIEERPEARPVAAAAPVEASAARLGGDLVQDMFGPPAAVETPRPTAGATPRTPPRRAPARRADSDVDLLTALMGHAERVPPSALPAGPEIPLLGQAPEGAAVRSEEEAVRETLRSCPAANTPEGVRCRQRVCAAHWGLVESCPKPVAVEAGG